jgi:phage baseplate assembly protein gpV
MSAAEIEVFADTEQGEPAESRRKRAPAKARNPQPINGVVIGTLIGFTSDSQTPLVVFPQSGSAASGQVAVAAAAIVDLHGPHIGRQVVLQFENGDAARPIVMGVVRGKADWPLAEHPGHVQVDADGERLIVGAKQQLVLKCGKASITLTKAGKIVINGTYVSNRSSGVMRIKGGSVQLN